MKHLNLLIVCIFLTLLSFSSCAPKVPAQTEFVIGTICTVNLFDKGSAPLYSEIFDRLRVLESILSANRDNTNLANINASAGLFPVKVESETIEVLNEALIFSEKTNGVFDPSVGPLVKTWNIGTDYAAVPSEQAIHKALSLIDYRNIILDSENQTVFLKQKEMRLDFGAIAKGYAADEIVQILQTHNIKRALIDLGGNVFAVGEKKPGKSWIIGIRDPETNQGNSIMTIPVSNKSIVTSGVYERFFEQDGIRYHHILDTHTGYPVENNLLSVTIITGKSIQADALSTSVFALGSEKGKLLLKSIPDTEAIFVFKDKHIEATEKIVSQIHLLSPDYTIIR